MSIRIEDLYSKESQEKVLADLYGINQLLGLRTDRYTIPIQVGNYEAECAVRADWEEPRWNIFLDKPVYELDELLLIKNVIFVAKDEALIHIKKLVAYDRNPRVLEPFAVDELEVYRLKGFHSIRFNKNARVIMNCPYKDCIDYRSWIDFFVLLKMYNVKKVTINLNKESFKDFDWYIEDEVKDYVLKNCDLCGLGRILGVERIKHITFYDTHVRVKGYNRSLIIRDLEYSDKKTDEIMKNLVYALEKSFEEYRDRVSIIWDGE